MIAPGPASPVIPDPADAAQQWAEHVVRELLEPVNGNAEHPLRLSARLALGPCPLRPMLRLPGWPGVGVTLEREAQDPVSLSPIASHRSASEIAGHVSSLAYRTGPGQRRAGSGGPAVTAIPALGHWAGRLSG